MLSWVMLRYEKMAGMMGWVAMSWTVVSCQVVAEMGVEGRVGITCFELLGKGRNGRGRSGCELSWAAKRWQR